MELQFRLMDIDRHIGAGLEHGSSHPATDLIRMVGEGLIRPTADDLKSLLSRSLSQLDRLLLDRVEILRDRPNPREGVDARHLNQSLGHGVVRYAIKLDVDVILVYLVAELRIVLQLLADIPTEQPDKVEDILSLRR